MEQLKKGDWVIHNGKHKVITKMIDGLIDSLDYNTTIIWKNDQLELWIPEPGEWCWFWDEHYTTAILAKFENISNGLFVEHHGNIFEYCEPFIGELPSNLKDS